MDQNPEQIQPIVIASWVTQAMSDNYSLNTEAKALVTQIRLMIGHQAKYSGARPN